MPKKDKYWYVPWVAVILSGAVLGLIGKLVAEKQGVSSGSSWLIFVLIVAVVILAYLLFNVLWEPLFEKIFGKKLTPKPRYRPDLPENSALQSKIESFCRYSDEILSGYVSKDDLVRLHIYISQYAQSNMGDISQKVSTSGLDNFELYHYGWNIWNHFEKVVGQDKTADWLINVFTELSGSKNIIYKKFKHDERGTYKIPLEPNIK